MIVISLERELDIALHTSIDMVKEVFAKIYEKYSKLVYYLISKKVECKEDCEELTNDVFIGFFNNINSFDTSRSIKYYLMSSATNKVKDYLRIKKDKNISFDDSYLVEEVEDNYNLVYREFIDEWKNLTNNFEIKVIVKHIIYGYTFNEIAVIDKCSINTVKSAYKRGIAKIRKYYDEKEKIYQ